ncbi:MAG: GxxExxY protein [Ignavibacteriales bacterium]|nr:GxxExxY protein [Ignavibacteriales bacterium]
MTENELSKEIIGAAMEVHKALGPGLLESAYEASLRKELGLRGFVENKVIIEIKAVDAINDVHLAQVLTYLKLSNCKLRLLIHFNVAKLRDGIKRPVNHLDE